MTDTAPTPPAVPQSSASPASPVSPTAQAPNPPAAPAPPATFSAEDVQAIVSQAVAQAVAQVAPSAPAPSAPNPPAETNLFAKGNLVVHSWDDHYDGPSTRYGIVVDTVPADTENLTDANGTPVAHAGAKSVVAWLPPGLAVIGDHELSAV